LRLVQTCRLALKCGACGQLMEEGIETVEKVRQGNSPKTAFLTLVGMGLCPLCGEVCNENGQTPDEVIERWMAIARRVEGG